MASALKETLLLVLLVAWVGTYLYLGRLLPRVGSPSDTLKKQFERFASVAGKVFIFSGGFSILLGAVAANQRLPLRIGGIATVCYGIYLLLVARRLRERPKRS